MASFFYFSGKNGISLGSSMTSAIAEFLRPYMAQLGLEEKIYFHYDLYAGVIKFDELTVEQYNECYLMIEKAIENDLPKNQIIHNETKGLILRIWQDEFKPEMKKSPLYKEE